MKDLDLIKLKLPLSEATLKRNPHLNYDTKTNPDRVRAEQPQPAKGSALERRVSRKETSGPRFKIVFTIYARRPCDWDGYHIKPLQDLLIESGILFGDCWHQLEGCVCSRKVPPQGQEFTQIEIIPIETVVKT